MLLKMKKKKHNQDFINSEYSDEEDANDPYLRDIRKIDDYMMAYNLNY